MNTILKRMCINPKDIARINGITPRHARNVLNDLKLLFKKEKHQCLSVKEYSKHTGFSVEEIEKYML
jgi:hypothetical protein